MPVPGTTAEHPAAPAAAPNSPATAAVLLGALGLFTSFALVGGPVGLAGLVTAGFALRTARRTGTGRGRAVAGLLLSLAAVALSVLAAVLLAWYANHTQQCYRPDGLHQYVECVRRSLSDR
ncbi:DUF4190 domain-containing protein [Kitasatospora cineracea]|uniref:DUF4190 domain-containing protein n=1 Tax=Kitasatospora cineracea TaxID=88074 RepID=A0A8G1X7X7_9ACTN|nr:DUF4190 domain-containing protein [Kitasatospora cineracea]ROR35278.1 hypothetical protein EDD39_6935 [Kitasatospora cineracea]